MTPTARERRLRFALLATCCLLLALLAVLASKAVPLSEAVRLRNALHFDSAPAASFEWTPSSRPDDFVVEDAPADERLLQAAAAAGGQARSGRLGERARHFLLSDRACRRERGIDDGLFVVLKRYVKAMGRAPILPRLSSGSPPRAGFSRASGRFPSMATAAMGTPPSRYSTANINAGSTWMYSTTSSSRMPQAEGH